MPRGAARAPAKEAALTLEALAAAGAGGGDVGSGGASGGVTEPSGAGGGGAGSRGGQACGGALGEDEDLRSGEYAREGALGDEGGGEPRGAPSGGTDAEAQEADGAGPSVAAPLLTRKRAPTEVFDAKDGVVEGGSTDDDNKKKQRLLHQNRAAQIRYRARRKLKEQELKDSLDELQSVRDELVQNKALVLGLTQQNTALERMLAIKETENATLRTMVSNLVPGLFGERAATASVADLNQNQALALGVAGAVPGQPQPQLAHQAQLAHHQQQSALQQLQLLLGAQAAQPAVLGANQARAPLANPIVQAAPCPLGQPAPARPPAYDAAGSSVPTLGQVLSQLQPTLQPSLALTHYNTASADARQIGRGRRGDGQGEHGQGDHGQGHHGRPSR